MISIVDLFQRHKHPLSWLYITLFYINLFVGLWLHNWLLIVTSVTGVFAVTLFQPPVKKVPAWSERMIQIISEQWLDTAVWLRVVLLVVSLLITAGLFYALWQNSVFGTTLSLLVLFAIKGYFWQKPLCVIYGRYADKVDRIKHKNGKSDQDKD